MQASNPPQPPLTPSRFTRVEYLGFQDVPGHREYQFAVYGEDPPARCRFTIALAAFTAGRVRMQDGPDVCYQRLLRALAAGETVAAHLTTIDDVELASYRESHTPVPKRRASTARAPLKPKTPLAPRIQPRPQPPRPPDAPQVSEPVAQPFEEGQRVSHAVFGVGVVTASGGGHTVVRFDEEGPKKFVTSMLKLDVLSAPHTWETTPRGKNRPRG
jgi:hypothetical protein